MVDAKLRRQRIVVRQTEKLFCFIKKICWLNRPFCFVNCNCIFIKMARPRSSRGAKGSKKAGGSKNVGADKKSKSRIQLEEAIEKAAKEGDDEVSESEEVSGISDKRGSTIADVVITRGDEKNEQGK